MTIQRCYNFKLLDNWFLTLKEDTSNSNSHFKPYFFMPHDLTTKCVGKQYQVMQSPNQCRSATNRLCKAYVWSPQARSGNDPENHGTMQDNVDNILQVLLLTNRCKKQISTTWITFYESGLRSKLFWILDFIKITPCHWKSSQRGSQMDKLLFSVTCIHP
jgi:hypothetical protein